MHYALLPLNATKSYTWTFEALHTSPFFTEQPFKVHRIGTWDSAAPLTARNDRPASCFDTPQHIETPRASYDCWGIHRPRPPPSTTPPHHGPLGLRSQLARQIAVVTSDCGLVFAIISVSRLNSAVKIHTVHRYSATQSTVSLCGFRGEQIYLSINYRDVYSWK